MYIIVSEDGKIWNYDLGCFQDETDGRGQTYIKRSVAKRAAMRVGSLQGSLAGDLHVMTYGEWAKKTGSDW